MWTDEKIDYLKEYYGGIPVKKMAGMLGVKEYAIYTQASKLKIKSKYRKEYAVYFGDEYQFNGDADYCCRRLGVKYPTFIGYVSKSGRFEDGIHVVDIGKWRPDR